MLPWRPVEANVAPPLDVLGKSRGDFTDRSKELIGLVGLTGFEKALPESSRRHAPARSDHPGAVHLAESADSRRAVRRGRPDPAPPDDYRAAAHLDETRATTLLVTRCTDEVVFLADRIAVMRSRPGRIVDIDLPRPRPPRSWPPPSSIGSLTSSPEPSVVTERQRTMLGALRNGAIIFVPWEIVGRLQLVASGAPPLPIAILARL